MKLLIITSILLMSFAAHADNFYSERNIKDLRVIDADHDAGMALVVDKNGNQAEIYIGDTIGIDGGTVTTIEDTFIIIETGESTTKIRVIKGHEKANTDASEIDAPDIGSF